VKDVGNSFFFLLGSVMCVYGLGIFKGLGVPASWSGLHACVCHGDIPLLIPDSPPMMIPLVLRFPHVNHSIFIQTRVFYL